MTLSIAPDAIAVDYVVAGRRTAAAVAAGRSRLIGAIIQEPDQLTRFVDQELTGLLRGLGNRQRLYPDALFALAVEAMNDLPPPANFHDFHALTCVLYGQNPFRWQPKLGMDQPSLISMSQEKCTRRASYVQFLDNARQEQLESVYEQIELPVIMPTLAMTLAGVPVNIVELKWLITRKGNLRISAASLLRHVQSERKVFANLDPLGTLTGRYSCSDPPLQALDRRIRKAIVASHGCVLMEADYSQMELRLLAHFAQDAALLHAFQHDIDLHVGTAASVLDIAEADVTAEQRKLGKMLNFGIAYGQTAYGLADELDVPVQHAEALLAAHSATYPDVAAWIARVKEKARNTGEVRTLYGRRRQLPNIRSTNEALAAEARRHAVNTIIQGTAADLLKLALIRLHNELPSDVHMLLPVHDSVLLEVPLPMVEETRKIVIEAMETAPASFTVPLKVEVTTGRTWAACKSE